MAEFYGARCEREERKERSEKRVEVSMPADSWSRRASRAERDSETIEREKVRSVAQRKKNDW